MPLKFWRVLTPAATVSGHTEQRSLNRMGFFVLNRVRVLQVTKACCALPNGLVRLAHLSKTVTDFARARLLAADGVREETRGRVTASCESTAERDRQQTDNRQRRAMCGFMVLRNIALLAAAICRWSYAKNTFSIVSVPFFIVGIWILCMAKR